MEDDQVTPLGAALAFLISLAVWAVILGHVRIVWRAVRRVAT
jgi:hypothetical protein